MNKDENIYCLIKDLIQWIKIPLSTYLHNCLLISSFPMFPMFAMFYLHLFERSTSLLKRTFIFQNGASANLNSHYNLFNSAIFQNYKLLFRTGFQLRFQLEFLGVFKIIPQSSAFDGRNFLLYVSNRYAIRISVWKIR